MQVNFINLEGLSSLIYNIIPPSLPYIYNVSACFQTGYENKDS